MKSKSILYIIFACGIIIAFLSVIGVYAIWQFWPENVTPITDETANWQIYRSDEYGIELKCPGEWWRKISAYGDYCAIDNLAGAFYVTKSDLTDWGRTMISECDNNPEKIMEYAPMKILGKTIINNMNFCITEENFEGAYDRTYNAISGNYQYRIFYRISSGSHSVPEEILQSAEVKSQLDLLPKIVSTFKFISTNDETAGWQTYRNDGRGFELNYPQEFTPDENDKYPTSGSNIVMFRRFSYGDWSFGIGDSYYISSLGRNETFQEAVKNYPFKDENSFQQNLITVAGKESQEFSYLHKFFQGVEEIETISIYIPKDNGEYFNVEWKADENISANQRVQNSKDQFYKILSTFKFINN